MLITFLFGDIIVKIIGNKPKINFKGEICMKKKTPTNCETCNNYTYIEDYGYFVCDVNLDEDEM